MRRVRRVELQIAVVRERAGVRALSAVPPTWALPVAFANRPVPPVMVVTPENRIVVGPVGTAVPCDVANS